jgi:hypothetical protein
MVELTCRYAIVGRTRSIEMLKRVHNACSARRPIGQAVLRPGAVATVPDPADGGIVIATIDYPVPFHERAITSFFKPMEIPTVVANGKVHTFLTGTAASDHLMHVPEEFGGRRVTNGGLDISEISFPDSPGPVVVRFYELRLR